MDHYTLLSPWIHYKATEYRPIQSRGKERERDANCTSTRGSGKVRVKGLKRDLETSGKIKFI